MSGYNQPNPYHAPPVAHENKPGGVEVPGRTVAMLQRTRPWALFIGIVSLISCGFCFIGSIAMLTIDMSYSLRPGAEMVGVWLAVGYGLMGFIMLVIGISCVRYGSRIRQFMYQQTQDRLDQALDAQLSYWRLIGIITIVCLVLMVLGMLMGVFAAAPSSRGRF